jgi:GntR family transcriptional regulator
MTNKKLMLEIDFRAGLPIYIQIVNQVQAQIAGGILKPGDQLPTVRSLAEELRVNFNTVARAYRILDEAHHLNPTRAWNLYHRNPAAQGYRAVTHELQALTERYINEARRLEFSKEEISEMIKDQIQAWEDSDKPGQNGS